MRNPFSTKPEEAIMQAYIRSRNTQLAPYAEEKLKASANAAIGRYAMKSLAKNVLLCSAILIGTHAVVKKLDD